MNRIIVEEKYILEYIKDMLLSYKLGSCTVNSAKYHHNTEYSDAPSICRYGILTLKDLKRYEIKDYTDDFLKKMGDIESHINGNDAVSLAIVDLKNLYQNEYEYNPFMPSKVDFLVSSDVTAGRSTIHYGNEFLCHSSIDTDKLRAIDVRLLKMIQSIEKESKDKNSVLDAIEKYNNLQVIALTMLQCELNIPLREMSHQDNFSIDIEKLSSSPKLVLK